LTGTIVFVWSIRAFTSPAAIPTTISAVKAALMYWARVMSLAAFAAFAMSLLYFVVATLTARLAFFSTARRVDAKLSSHPHDCRLHRGEPKVFASQTD
jgi:hypothetical protein